MADRTTGERPRRGHFSAKAETLALLKVSGNPTNGLGETAQRRPSPFFWHPPTMHPFGDLQVAARARMRECPGFDVAFEKARNHPELVPVATTRGLVDRPKLGLLISPDRKSASSVHETSAPR